MRLSASKFRLAVLCGYAFRPDVEAPAGRDSEYAARGRALHALVEEEPLPDGLSDSDAAVVHDWFEAWERSPWSAVEWRHEVAFAYDPATDTARELANQDGHRDYSGARHGEIVGTADLVCVDEDGAVVVADIKTGWQADAEPVERHSQLRFLALAAARALGADEARIQVLKLDAVQLAATEARLDVLDLAEVASETKALVGRILASEPAPGSHCDALYCPALAVCPATTALVREARETKPALPAFALRPPETDAEALRLRDGAAVLEEVAAEATALWRAYCDAHGGVALPDGKVLRRVEVSVEKIAPLDGEAFRALREAGLEAAVETKRTTSKEALKKFVAQRTGLKGKALDEAVETQALAPLRTLGATKTQTHPEWKAVKS